MKRTAVLVMTAFLVYGAGASPAGKKFTAAAFEKSALFKKYELQEKDTWSLKAGGHNFYYRFDNPGVPGESMTVEMQGQSDDLRRLSVSWPGDLPVTRLDAHEATLLKELVTLFEPSASPAQIIAYARANAGTRYSGGSNAMPRKQFGNLRVFAGQTVQLIVGLEKPER